MRNNKLSNIDKLAASLRRHCSLQQSDIKRNTLTSKPKHDKHKKERKES